MVNSGTIFKPRKEEYSGGLSDRREVKKQAVVEGMVTHPIRPNEVRIEQR
jgi:hypothetical protein